MTVEGKECDIIFRTLDNVDTRVAHYSLLLLPSKATQIAKLQMCEDHCTACVGLGQEFKLPRLLESTQTETGETCA